MGQWITKELAKYAVETGFADHPADAVDLAKTFILDNLGCMIGGAQTALGRSMIDTVGQMGGAKQASVVGTSMTVPTIQAALINGTTANALDFDETLEGLGHPSSSVIPAALALGESKSVSGRDLITAILVGYDVGNRVGRAIQPTYERLKQVWCVGTWQTFGAVAAAAKILGLDLEQTLNAYGIAGATAPLPNTQKWGWDLSERPIHWVKEPTGWPSWTGTLAAELATTGFVGNRFILDGDNGFWIMAGSDRCDFERMTRGLGQDFEVRHLSIKPYPSCRWQHAALDCVQELKARHAIAPEQVERVSVRSFDWVVSHEIYAPKDMVDAEFSLPHTVAMVLLGHPPGPRWYAPDVLHDPDVIAFSRKVTVDLDEEINRAYHEDDKIGARVEIVTTDGAVYQATSDSPTGDPDKPLGKADVESKFRNLANGILDPDAVDRLVANIARLEELEDITPMLRLTRTASA
jgi:2-methylcitrate dehydratase PrpD